ncbi:hypothetical protein B0H34DRAFT_686863 [Crassisporium funariophilum]|nr:hypothetical protein B0H34DRAFT_686863 [Crassisporium funariophilum]
MGASGINEIWITRVAVQSSTNVAWSLLSDTHGRPPYIQSRVESLLPCIPLDSRPISKAPLCRRSTSRTPNDPPRLSSTICLIGHSGLLLPISKSTYGHRMTEEQLDTRRMTGHVSPTKGTKDLRWTFARAFYQRVIASTQTKCKSRVFQSSGMSNQTVASERQPP